MLLYSEQLRILKNAVISQKNDKLTYTKITDKELQKYKIHYNPEKFEGFVKSEFFVLVNYIVYKNKFSLIKLCNYLRDTPLKELNLLKNQITEILLNYEFYFLQDYNNLKPYNLTSRQVISKYKKNEINFLYLYWFLYHNGVQGRIQEKQFRDLRLFLSYFGKIQEYLHNFEGTK
jgi:hypothetical protein